jgi:tRNA (guanine-N(7)-)-methyltransferase subunit TRM82
MPKRPSDMALTADNSTILIADKFGDVYAIPLVPSAETLEPSNGDAAAAAAAETAPKAAAKPPVSKGANAMVVHSQRNLKALEDQKRQRQNPPPERKEGPAFTHELLLGHVSMLTAVAVAADAAGRPYILSADRDEHVRVSRGMPQAHVIASFCLGHAAFINALCLPRPDVLVSAGGDDDLYVWDWLSGTLQAKVHLLGHVQAVVPDATKVAVSQLVSREGSVLVICER